MGLRLRHRTDDARLSIDLDPLLLCSLSLMLECPNAIRDPCRNAPGRLRRWRSTTSSATTTEVEVASWGLLRDLSRHGLACQHRVEGEDRQVRPPPGRHDGVHPQRMQT